MMTKCRWTVTRGDGVLSVASSELSRKKSQRKQRLIVTARASYAKVMATERVSVMVTKVSSDLRETQRRESLTTMDSQQRVL